MSLVLVNQGEIIMLEALVNKTAPQNLVLRLFQNNVTPAEVPKARTLAPGLMRPAARARCRAVGVEAAT